MTQYQFQWWFVCTMPNAAIIIIIIIIIAG